MADKFYLTQSDKDFLDYLKGRFQGSRENAPIARLRSELYDDAEQAPEVYVALVPSGGIPAATGSGGGGFDYTQGDVPGMAVCQIFNILNGSLTSIEKSQPVYNLSSTAVSQSWITIVRTKFGRWIAQTGGGGGGTCNQNEIWQIEIIGEPLGGSFDVTFTVVASDTITINYDSTAAQAKTAFATHTNLSASDLTVTGGNLPYVNISVEFGGSYANTAIGKPTIDKTGLSTTVGTGTVGDITGVGVVISRFQKGSPN